MKIIEYRQLFIHVGTTPSRIYSMIYGLGGTVYILETTEIIKVS